MDLPALPEPIPVEQLHTLGDAELDAAGAGLQAAERATIAAMSPYDLQLREIRTRAAELSTERRRRERAAQVTQRAGVRERARSGEMPSLAAALAGPGDVYAADTPLTSIRAFLATGGEVGFGFATRPGSIGFTDGRQALQVRTWGEAVELHRQGWDPGTPGVPGVRVHLAGSRVERVVSAEEVALEGASAAG